MINKKKTKCILLIQLFLIFNLILIISFQSNVFNIDNINENSDYVIEDPNLKIQTSSSGLPEKYYFKYYKIITIDHNKVSGIENHKDFPILISILDSDLHNETQENGNDIAFANSTTWLNHELELFNKNYNSTHAQLIAWVRVPLLYTSIDTNITMYYGNSTMGPMENPEGVWDSSYEGVWHLKEDPGPGGSGDIKDSTINNNHGTAISMGSGDQVTGKIDGCLDFDGNTDPDYVNVGNVGSGINTIEFWLNPDTFTQYDSYYTDYKSPTATGAFHNDWANPTGAYTSDNNRASEATYLDDQDWYNFGFNIPTDAIIEGILVSIEGSTSTYGQTTGCRIRLSWNGGSSYTDYKSQSWYSTFDSYRTVGGSTDTWGRSWSPSEFNNGNFRIWLEKTGSSIYALRVDHIQIRVYYSSPVDMPVIDLDGTDQILIDHNSGDIKPISFPGSTTIYINGAIGSTVTTGNWNHVVITDTTGFDALDLDIGRNSSIYYDGKVDELRLSDTVRTANWISTEYNNQYDPTSFYIIGQRDKVDTSPPTYSGLTESADPLELGDTEVISINITDPSSINQVDIVFESSNESMTRIIGNLWQYDSWTPESVGNYTYTIYMKDNYNNWNSTSGSIEVIDTTPPTYSNLIESADPLKCGQNETITIKVFDYLGSGVNQTILEYESSNHSMIYIGENTWSWSKWKPSPDGVYIYKIYMQDMQNNWNVTSGNITVITTTAPIIENLTKSADPLELGNEITISIDAVDNETSVYTVLIELENLNHTMNHIGGNTYEYNWTGALVGTVPYTIYANDTGNNWNKLSDSFDIIDTTPPTFTDLIENQDPLELGKKAIISINCTDLSDVNQVRIEFEGSNRSMDWIIGDIWEYDSWTPNSVGNYIYIIYIRDNYNNWNSTSGSIEVIDTTPPTFSNLIESPDPVELGDPLTITIIVTDLTDTKQVLIEFENSNHSMANIGSDIWQYDSWIPNRAGNYSYKIYMKDYYDNLNSTMGSITFQDTISPIYSNLIENSDPLELGDNMTISVEIYDFAGINRTLIEFEGSNHSMTNIYGNTWQYKSWKPNNRIVYNYRIFMEDYNSNWNFTSGDITVQDTNAPLPPILTNSPSGDVSGILVFDWLDGNDPSGIAYYILIVDNELNPDITPGYLFQFNITSSFYEFSEPLAEGIYYFFLYQIDGAGYQSDSTIGSFNFINPSNGDDNIILFIIIGVIGIVGSILTAIIVKKKIHKEMAPPRKLIPLKIIIPHIKKITDSKKSGYKEGAGAKVKVKEKDKKLFKESATYDETMESRIEEIKILGQELFDEGAYLEARIQFELAKDLLLGLGKKEEAEVLSEIIVNIETLVEERETHIKNLDTVISEGNPVKIVEIYYDLIEISKKLREEDVSRMYQSELINYFQVNESKLIDLDKYKLLLEQRADSLYHDHHYDQALNIYDKCEKISHFMILLGKEEEEGNFTKFRDKKNECLKNLTL